ncbi:MAG: RNA-protein complex protein Nop10 [Candidatus Caldarchaeum sp.]|nr:RNA-protein complex protein Nop10 [Candidatus Caldarchaeum sp.]MCS7138188.1 RNA-protein complex protein Nop10 [Candidatus Caldarchaeum sp.]MDW7977302.1 nucleolar RNA-binding Nop10p family protein [Candidatus Caldarchaeum sp.]MDW8360048.1 nucleolar RNA-binding Nop10p family protein [Candidatus Caldarchaeum sp.]
MKAGRLRRCPSCRTYTLKESCPSCGERTLSPHPVHFIPDSRMAELLLKARRSLHGKQETSDGDENVGGEGG